VTADLLRLTGCVYEARDGVLECGHGGRISAAYAAKQGAEVVAMAHNWLYGKGKG
jgi:hypothetical protein